MSCAASNQKISVEFAPDRAVPARRWLLLRILTKLGKLFAAARRRQVRIEFEKARQRSILLTLDDRLLRDIGVTRDEAMREARKALWK